MVLEQRRRRRRHHDIHRSPRGELREERRRQDDITEKTRLYYERSHETEDRRRKTEDRRRRTEDRTSKIAFGPRSLVFGLFYLQHRQERLLWNLHRSDLLHPLLSLLLLLEQLPLPRDVAAVALGEHILPQRFHRRPRDHLHADRGLDRHLEQLARNQFLQFVGDLAAPLVRLVLVDDHAEGVDRVAVDQHV